MARYTMGEVRIKSSVSVNPILELSMNVGVNCHGVLAYGGLISEEDAIRIREEKQEHQLVKLFLKDELEFCGHPLKVTIDYKNDAYYLRVLLTSRSQLLDITSHNRFFQDTSRTYADIIAEAYKDSATGTLSAFRWVQKHGSSMMNWTGEKK